MARSRTHADCVTQGRRGQRRLRRWLRVAAWGTVVVGVLVAVAVGTLALLGMSVYEIPQPSLVVEVTSARVERGKRLTSMLCNRCHFDHDAGSLRGRALDEIPSHLGQVSAPNITRDEHEGIGGWSAAEIAVLLRTGIHPKTGRIVPPVVMPRWPGLADDDLAAIIALLQSSDPWVEPRPESPPPTEYSLFAKYRALVEWSPLPYPRAPIGAPDAAGEPVARGAYLVDRVLQCGACHSASWGEIDGQHPRETPGYLAGGAVFHDANLIKLQAVNLTPHATGLGGWTSEQLQRALLDGFGPDDKVLRWPMRRYPGLGADDVEAIYAYLQTRSPVDNAMEPEPTYRLIGRKANGGRHIYLLYGCQYCHGTAGQGVADLRDAGARFATDEALVAFLKAPAREDPLTIMPAWDGVIAEDDYAPLCAYVRSLGEDSGVGGE